MIVWLLIGGGGVLAVAMIALGLAKAAANGDGYLPQHALGDPAAEYGSMILAEEDTWYRARDEILDPHEATVAEIQAAGEQFGRAFLAAVTGPDWREQTAADLSPEALCGPEQPRERERSPGNENRDRGTDSGPGVGSSLAPGPDQEHVMEDVPGSHSGLHHSWACWCLHQPKRLGESEPCGVTAPPAPEPLSPPPLSHPVWRNPKFTVDDLPASETRLLRTTGEIMRADLLADVCAYMARQDAEVAMWLVSSQQRWAVA